jgi:hypothetical protein
MIRGKTLFPKGWFKMFKFETVVVILMINLTIGGFAFADGQTITVGNSGANCESIVIEAVKYPANSSERIYLTAKADKCEKDRSLGGDQCKTAPADWKKAQGEFSAACGKTSLGGDCAEEISKCLKTNSSSENDPDLSTSGRSTTKRNANQPYDPKSVDKMCPAMAGKDLEKLTKELNEQKDKVKKLEKEIPELEEKANKVMSSTNEKLQQIKNDMTSAQKDHAKELQAIDEEKQSADKAIAAQVTGLQAQISKARDALGQVSITRLEGQLKLKQTKTQADLNCHASASAQVAKMQTDVMAATSLGTYNRSGFTGLLKNVGLSDRAQWQRVAKKYYQWCLDSKPTMDTKDGANDGYKLLIEQSNKSEASIREQIKDLQTQQGKLVGNVPCNQIQGVSDRADCQAARNAYNKAQQSEADYRASVQTATEKYQQLAQQGTREYQSLAKQATTKKQEISQEKQRLDNLQQYLQAKLDKAGGNLQKNGSVR